MVVVLDCIIIFMMRMHSHVHPNFLHDAAYGSSWLWHHMLTTGVSVKFCWRTGTMH